MNLFSQKGSHILFNPRLSPSRGEVIRNIILQQQIYKDHFWLMSSGTESAQQGRQKMVALSPEAILCAAEGVVRDFALTPKDVYLKSLPTFHIGGLSIYARAHVAGFKVIEARETLTWSPEQFLELLGAEQVSVASLVPTQVYDLVQKKSIPPASLRWIFVGGGSLSQSLFEEACALGWPLVLTYGMTEASAMVATKKSYKDGFQKLSHIKDWRVEKDHRLSFLSSSLLSAYLFVSLNEDHEFSDPKVNGWYLSDDCGEIKNGELMLKGRSSEFVKIQGESVSLLEVQNLWDQHQERVKNFSPAVVVAVSEERRGFDLVLVTTGDISRKLLEDFNQKVLPFQRLAAVQKVASFPANEMGKISRTLLASQISNKTYQPK